MAVAIAAIIATPAAHALTKEIVVDISNNLYYSGLVPKSLTAPFSGGGRDYDGHNVPSKGYPDAPLTWEKYVNTAIHACLRNAPPVNAAKDTLWDRYGQNDPDITDDDEVNPIVAGATVNSVPDAKLGCFGSPPVIIDVTDLPNPFYIKIQGTINSDPAAITGENANKSLDARGQLDSADLEISENGINANALIGIWASSPKADLKAHVDAAWDTDPTSLFSDPGFTPIDKEFGVVDGLNLGRANALVDVDKDGVADEGTGEFQGVVNVPAGATHLILANNARQGSFYHNSSVQTLGTGNPLFDLVPEAIRSTKLIPGTSFANPYYLDANATDIADTFAADIGFGDKAEDVGTYPAGHRRAVGVFMVTLSDTAFDAPPPVEEEPETPVTEDTGSSSSGGGGGSFGLLGLLGLLSLRRLKKSR